MPDPICYGDVVGRERSMAPFIPQSSHATSNTIINREGDLQRTWQVGGLCFETLDPEDVHIPKEQLNTLIRSIGSSRVALWQHTCRKGTTARLDSDFHNDFCREFDDRYRRTINNDQMMTTRLYLTLIYRPTPSRSLRALIRAGRRSVEEILDEQRQAIKALDDIAWQVESSLKRYNLTVLGTYRDQNKTLCSDALSFINYLLCGVWQKIQVPRGPVNEYLGSAWLHVGSETIEVRTAQSTRYAQCIDFKEYNGFTEPGILNGLMYEPYEFVITQSFSLSGKSEGEKVLRRQQRHLSNTEDGSASQIAQMEQAIDELIDGQFVMGEYHFSMMVYGESTAQVRLNTKSAMSIIEEQGFLGSLATTATDAAWYAQLPGNWFYRPRVAHLTSRNFAGLACLHSFPAGKADGNPWGDAVTIFKTPSGQPFFFNFHHASRNQDQYGAQLLGNTRIIGKSGVGKTVLLNTLFLQSQKYDNRKPGQFTTVFFDKDEGAKLCILASGGQYLSIENGQPTGMNPFRMKPSESNILFLEQLVRALASGNGQQVSTADELRISQGVRTVMRMPERMRRLSTLLQNMTEGTAIADRENSIVKRLAKWCADDGAGKRGALAWVLDCEEDLIDLETHANYGIDGTHFLDNDEVRTPITLYLLHRMKSVIDGRRFINWMDEAWKWLDDPAFAEFAGDEQTTIRKKNGLCVFATQSPRTVLESSIAPELIEQVATEIYLPNPRATKSDYVNGFGLSEAEFRIVRELPEEGHRFLVKQDSRSVVAWLDLDGFDNELAILSGTTTNNAIAMTVINEVGQDPAHWLPEFHRRRRSVESQEPGRRHGAEVVA